MLYKIYRKQALSEPACRLLANSSALKLNREIGRLQTEFCFYVETDGELTPAEYASICEILGEPGKNDLRDVSHLADCATVIDRGPLLNFPTVSCSTALKFFRRLGIMKIERFEYSTRYGLSINLTSAEKEAFLANIFDYDEMREGLYDRPIETFKVTAQAAPMQTIPFLQDGDSAIWAISEKQKLNYDKQDVAMLANLYRQLARNPTDVETFQLGQGNSEHSRHHFFQGLHLIDGARMERSLMKIVKEPWEKNPNNSLIAFNDDSSAIRGFETLYYAPANPGNPSVLKAMRRTMHFLLTAETHNHPSAISPFHGGATGLGGWLRDLFSTRNGSLIGIAGSGYQFGNLHLPGYFLPWETEDFEPTRFAKAAFIAIEASNGVTDYGNCFGIPLVYGFVRTHPRQLKPIIYMGGAGMIDDRDLTKQIPEAGMRVVYLGPPRLRVGLGGGSGSSSEAGKNSREADFNSVQRGDPFSEQPLWRTIRACVEMPVNPIVYMTDLGAGGLSNAGTEVVHPCGAKLYLRRIPVGDKTMAPYEIWGNESQESCVIIVHPADFATVEAVAKREGCDIADLGETTGDGKIVVEDERDGTMSVNLPLEEILGNLPKKTFELKSAAKKSQPLALPEITLKEALERVLRFPAVASKRWLTSKGDRSVTGLVGQQQCVGPNQLPLADFAILCQSFFENTGCAVSFGERQALGEISPRAMARMAVTEAILNLGGARYTCLEDIRCSANWMLAAKEPGEGAWLVQAAQAMSEFMIELGIAVDGGKDSLSMNAEARRKYDEVLDRTKQMTEESLKIVAPGQLVVAPYVPMEDVRKKVTPDLKFENSELIWIDLSPRVKRLGGSSLAQVYNQTGDNSPDVESEDLKLMVKALHQLLDKELICSYHDTAGDGLLVCLLEMAFGGNLGLDLNIHCLFQTLPMLFAEEAGAVIETTRSAEVGEILRSAGIFFCGIGQTGTSDGRILIRHSGEVVLDESMPELRDIWEQTSFELDRLQSNPECVDEEQENIRDLIELPNWRLSFSPEPTSQSALRASIKPKIAILREQGSNGDREMGAFFEMAGFEAWDVNTIDLLENKIALDSFQGLALVGGFSFRDVFGAGKAWAEIIKRTHLKEQFDRFFNRPDTFSFSVCNGFQAATQLGWLEGRLMRNRSERFESRFLSVTIKDSPAIMLKGMAGSAMGIWVAHGEGRYGVEDKDVLGNILHHGLAPIRYVDPRGHETENYPFNPNGSILGIAGVCSLDGRHLGMMPHAERGFLLRQWGWLPNTWNELEASPLLRMTQNAYRWCIDNR